MMAVSLDLIPAMIRVVQIEPGPIRPSPRRPRARSAPGPSAVATLPATKRVSGNARGSAPAFRTLRVSVRGVEDEHVHARVRRARRDPGSRPDPDRGRRDQAPTLVLRRARESPPLEDVLDREQPVKPTSSTIGSSILWRPMIASASSSVVPAARSPGLSPVITSRMVRDPSVSNRRSRFVMMPRSRPPSSTTGTPDAARLHQPAHRGSVGRVPAWLLDHPALRALYTVDLPGLLLDGELVDDSHAGSRAMAIAMGRTVTVSIAAETSGC